MEDYGTIQVCCDCMFTHANGGCGENPDKEPWGIIEPGMQVTLARVVVHDWEDRGTLSIYGSLPV